MGQGNMGVPTTTHFASELKQPDCLSTLHCRIVKNFGRITNNKVTSYHASRAQVTMLLIFQWVVGRGELLHACRPPGQISHFRSCLAAKAIVDDPGLFQYSRTPCFSTVQVSSNSQHHSSKKKKSFMSACGCLAHGSCQDTLLQDKQKQELVTWHRLSATSSSKALRTYPDFLATAVRTVEADSGNAAFACKRLEPCVAWNPRGRLQTLCRRQACV